jgi:hypothetical protein
VGALWSKHFTLPLDIKPPTKSYMHFGDSTFGEMIAGITAYAQAVGWRDLHSFCKNGARVHQLLDMVSKSEIRDVDVLVITCCGNDLLHPATSQESLTQHVEALVSMVHAKSRRSSFLIGEGSPALCARQPGYQEKLANLRSMFMAHGANVDTMDSFKTLSYKDALHFDPYQIAKVAPLFVACLDNAKTNPESIRGILYNHRIWTEDVIMQRHQDGYYYPHCIVCGKRANKGHMDACHGGKDCFDDLMGLRLPADASEAMTIAEFREMQIPRPVIETNKCYTASMDYNGVEMPPNRQGLEKGYLALRKGAVITSLVAHATPGHEGNLYDSYVYVQHESSHGWCPLAVVGPQL